MDALGLSPFRCAPCVRGCAPAEERGAILVMSAIMLVAIVGFAALAIDVGSYYQDQRQAQGAADAAALLGADEVASGTPPPASATTTSTRWSNDRRRDPRSRVNGNTVTVIVANRPELLRTHLQPAGDPTVERAPWPRSGAVSTACMTAGVNCWSIWAMDTSCSGGVQFSGGGYTVTGGIHSNGGLNTGGGGSHDGPDLLQLGLHTCDGRQRHLHQPWRGTPDPGDEHDLASGLLGQVPGVQSSGRSCTGPSGTPSYCNYAAASYPVILDSDPRHLLRLRDRNPQ